jgi:cytochrome c peroxidase
MPDQRPHQPNDTFLSWIVCLGIAMVCLPPTTATAQSLAPLPQLTDQPKDGEVELGKSLFFDTRLSGDATISCASCHDPKLAFTDGLPLSKGYPGSLYFRNTPTILNAAHQTYFYWDGRMSGDDLPSLVRDHIAEAHFMQADGRLVIERMRQVPEYERQFKEVYGGEPSYGKILNAVSAFVRSMNSENAPIDKFLTGDQSALSESAQRGFVLFNGKAKCIRCHHGPMFSDGHFHSVGVPPNPDVFTNPERHITFRRFFRTIGIGEYATIRFDMGCACVTKDDQQMAHFRTPSLREVSRTAPYMHNGMLATLEEVVSFYNDGGGKSVRSKEADLRPLGLSAGEQSDLVELLKAFSSEPIVCEPPTQPAYQVKRQGAH